MLDETDGGTATDSEGGHDGTLMDNPVWQPGDGQVNGAILLDGIDDITDGLGDHISIDDTGSDPNHQPDTWENSDLIDGMTVSAWMKLDEDGWSKDWEAIVGKATDSWELLRNDNNDNITFAIGSAIGSAYSGSNLPVEDNSWHQIVGVFDRNSVILYIDGIEADSIAAANPQIPRSAGKILIGHTNYPAVNPEYDYTFGGMIDEVRIYDAAVPYRADAEGTPGIVELYRADDGHDSCGGVYLPADLDEDCFVTLADFALLAADWMDCNDIATPDCD